MLGRRRPLSADPRRWVVPSPPAVGDESRGLSIQRDVAVLVHSQRVSLPSRELFRHASEHPTFAKFGVLLVWLEASDVQVSGE